MYNQARQWPFQMTAGLKPVQLVHNHQLRQLFLLFIIKKDLHEGIIEPLMSQTVWKNSVGTIRQVAFNAFIWPISGLVGVVIKYDKAQKEIRVEVTFREDADNKIGEDTNTLLATWGKPAEFPSPTLKYTFSEDEAGSRSFSKTKGG